MQTGRMTEDYGTATWRYWQEVTNALDPRASFQDRPPLPVRARITWEQDGTEGVDGMATRQGFDGAIFVELKEPSRADAPEGRLGPSAS